MFASSSKTALRKYLSISPVLFALSILLHVDTQAQPRGGRQPSTSTPTGLPSTARRESSGKSGTNISKRDPVPVKRATLTINLPSGSSIWVNQIEVALRNSEGPFTLGSQRITTTYLFPGILKISGLKTGACEITVRKPDHREFVQTLDLLPDRNNEITVNLSPHPGTLTVKPSVSGTSVEVLNAENNATLGQYRDQLDRYEIAPGNYVVNTSKDGYRTTTRNILVRPGESVYLEPIVELLPRPTPASTLPNAPVVRAVPTSFRVQTREKEEIFFIRSSSGNGAATLGTISVRHGGPLSTHSIDGALNGFPCQVDFVRLENVAEAAVIRAPGPSNEWNEIVIRLKRKDKKRPVSFAVNWKSLQPGGVMDHEPQTDVFSPARAVQRAKPNSLRPLVMASPSKASKTTQFAFRTDLTEKGNLHVPPSVSSRFSCRRRCVFSGQVLLWHTSG
jgi:hypothetical protein